MALPFIDETRALANQCFDRFYAVNGRDLDSSTPRADQEAFNLIRTGFSMAIRDAQRSGKELLALHFGELLNAAKRDGAYLWLHGLAIDGDHDGSLKPIGTLIAPIVARVHARQASAADE